MSREEILVSIPFLEKTGCVKAAFTTRHGGISQAPRESLNLSFSRGDDEETVRENYRRCAEAFGCDLSQMVLSRQPHGDRIEEVHAGDGGMRLVRDILPPERDAVMTDEPGVVLVTSHADCVPVYLVDTEHHAIAMVHAGWKGTSLCIAEKAVYAMRTRYGTDPGKLLAAIGPSIGVCCFEVGEDVEKIFRENFPGWDIFDASGEKTRIDLWACNEGQLLRAGVKKENIAITGTCTACHTQTFFSHRREKGQTGTMAALLTWTGEI